MARNRPTFEEPTSGEEPVEVPDPVVETAVEAPVEVAPPAPLAEPRKELDAARAFAGRSTDPMVQAFLTTEKLRPGKPRRRTRAEWNEELKAFVAAPR
jgi:hypothetical protein